MTSTAQKLDDAIDKFYAVTGTPRPPASITDRSDFYVGGYLRSMASDYNLRDDQRTIIAEAARRFLA